MLPFVYSSADINSSTAENDTNSCTSEETTIENEQKEIKINTTTSTIKSNNSKPKEIKVKYQEISNVDTFKLNTKSNVTQKTLEKYLSNYSKLSNWNFAETLVKVENTYDINAIFLIAIIRQESGNGKSWLAENYNNLGGLKSGDEWLKFDTKSECVEYLAELLSSQYLSETGEWFNGYTLNDISISYCNTDNWRNQVKNIVLGINDSIIELEKEFNNE